MPRQATAILYLYLAGSVCAAGAGSEPPEWRFAHTDAHLLVGVDLKGLDATPEGAEIRRRFAAALGAPLIDRAERLLMSSVFEADGQRSDILILSGRFEIPALRRFAQSENAEISPFRGIEIAAPRNSRTRDPHLGWLAKSGEGAIILIGTRPGIQAAVERSQNKEEQLGQRNLLFVRASELFGEFPLWLVCDSLPSGFGPRALDEHLDAGTAEDGVEGTDLGIRLGETAGLHLWIWTSGESVAEGLLSALQAGVTQKEPFVLAPWFSTLQGTLDGGVLALTAAMSRDRISSEVPALLAAFALPVDLAKPVQKTETQVPPAAKDLMVRIDGLDGGLKSVPYNPKDKD